MKDFFKKLGGLIKKNRKQIIKILVIAILIGGIAVGGYFILKACGFTTAEDFRRLRDTIGDNIWFWLLIATLQIIQVIFIPISNQIITLPVALIFNNELWKVFLTSWLSIWIATMILYFIGLKGGSKLLKWILGDQEQVDRCTKWLNKGWIFYPIGMLLPLPDDIVTVLAGTAKFNWLFVLVCSLLTRAVDAACTVWGLGYLTKFWWGWLILAIGGVLLLLMTYLFYKWEKQQNKKEELENEKN